MSKKAEKRKNKKSKGNEVRVIDLVEDDRHKMVYIKLRELLMIK